MTTQMEIENFVNKRTALFNNPAFIPLCIQFMKDNGIPAKEWNENQIAVMHLIANNLVSFLEDSQA
jgi:hypothetical protein